MYCTESRNDSFNFNLILDMKQEDTSCQESIDDYPDEILVQQDGLTCYSFKGARKYNDDKFDFIVRDQFVLAAVYDGHGGSTVSFYLKENLLKNITEHENFFTNPEKAIFQCLIKIQEQVISKFAETAGSTAMVALWTKNSIIVANIGDSVCYGFQNIFDQVETSSESFQNNSKSEREFKQYKKVELAEIHSLENEFERSKIRKRGGTIFKSRNCYRVAGELNLSRSIGDKKYKKWISAQPSITKFPINFTNLILATDGFGKKLQSINNPTQIHALIENMSYLKDNATLISISKPNFSA